VKENKCSQVCQSDVSAQNKKTNIALRNMCIESWIYHWSL